MQAWKRVALLLFCVGWGANHFVALLLVYKHTLALDAAAPAMLLGMYALGLVPGLLLSGPVSDRFGRRAVVLPAAIVALCASALLGLGGGSFALLLVGRLLYGMGAGAVMNPGAVWLLELAASDAAPGAGARRATIALSAGFGFGPLLSGVLAQHAPHPTLLPYVAQVAAMSCALAIAAGVPSAPRAGATGPLLRIGLDRDNRGAFLRGVVWMAPFVFAFPAIVFAALPALLGGGSSPSYVGALAAIALACGVLAQPVTRRFAPTPVARVGLVVGALGIALGAAAVAWHLEWMLLVTAPLLGGAYGVCMTSGLRTVELLAKPATRGGLTGLYYVLTYVGFAAPLGLAYAARAIPASSTLLIVAGLALLAAAALRPPLKSMFTR